MNPSTSDATGEMPVEMAEVLATVDLEHGGVATFLDLGDGHIGIAERVPVRAAPRAAASPLADPGPDSYACNSLGYQWVADWKDAFVGITKYREAAYAHNQSGTYLGACNGDERDDLVMEVHRRISGTWMKVHEDTIPHYEKYTFYSGIPGAYRARTYGAGGSTVEHYGVGAAWTLSPPEAIP